jgi:hypothetical protein
MASTITAKTLTVTVSESITLNGQAIDSENKKEISSVNEIDKRIVTVPFSAEKSLIVFGTAVAAGTYIRANVKYIRITNKDDTNFIRIQVLKTGADEFNIRLDAGNSFLMCNAKESVHATGGVFTAFVDADYIMAQADTADVDVELFVASI